jgi:hypothetical protein
LKLIDIKQRQNLSEGEASRAGAWPTQRTRDEGAAHANDGRDQLNIKLGF